MKTLKVATGLSLPLELVTQTIGVLAKRGAGKTYTAAVLAEELLGARLPVVVVDPIGVWWGLRAAANGKDPGLPILVMGGDHGDVPLEPGSGELVADLVVDERLPVVLDLSGFRKGEQTRWMEAFAEKVYRRNRNPLHLILDEADAFAPQRPMRGQERLLGAIEDLVRRGRARGLGLSLITQRAAVLNKNVLTQVQILVALRTIAPQDRDAVDAWIQVHGSLEERRTLMGSLPSLPVGTAWWWSPGWPTEEGIFQRVKIRRRRTFDSSATPKAGAKVPAPKRLAQVDLEGIRSKMAATIERQKADDPGELRKRIAVLEADLRKVRAAPPAPKVERVEVPALKPADVKRLEQALERVSKVSGTLLNAFQGVLAAAGSLEDQMKAATAARKETPMTQRAAPVAPGPGGSRVGPRPRSRASVATVSQGNGKGDLTGPEQRILDALAWLESVGQQDGSQTAVAFLSGYRVGGGAYNNPRGALRRKGLIEYRGSDRLALTPEGRACANAPDTPLTPAAMQEHVLARLPGPERRILGVLLQAYPKGLSNEELATLAGYSPGGGAYNNPRGRLRTLGLIDYRGGEVVAKPLLFLEGRA